MPSSLVTVQRQQEHSFLATEVPVEEYELEGTPIRPGRLHELSARGRTFKSTFHPLLSQGQCWISEKHVSVLSQSSFIGASKSILPEELLLYSFDIPHQTLSPARIKFMEECSVVFEELQQAHVQYAIPGYLNRFSKLYESHFEALCTALDADLNNEPPNDAEIEEEAANVSAAMNLVHLTQAIYFQPNPSAIMAEDLMHWVNRQESRPDPAEGHEIMKWHPACQHPSYWTFLQKAVSRALFKVAISCLKSAGLVEYNGVDRNLLDNIIHLLNNAPLGKQSQLARKGNELWDLKNAWNQWHSSVEKIQVASVRNDDARMGLGVVLKILRGDRETIANVSDSWQEYVASMAFFSRPFALNSYKDVRHLYDDAMNYGFNIDATLPSERAASALFIGELPRALVNCFKTDVALAVHLSDLLSKSGVLDDFEEGETMTLRDLFLLDYGEIALTNPQLPHVAFNYWKAVPPEGIHRIEEAIVRVPLKSQDQVDKFVDLCFDLQLDTQRADVCRAWARQLEQDNQIGPSILYFEKGHSFSDIERICWNHFERLLLTGGNDPNMDPKLVEILGNPPPSPMAGTLIAPLALLFNFYALKRQEDVGEAVKYLSKLFRLSSMPRAYIALLMAEMLPLFDGIADGQGLLTTIDKCIATVGHRDLFEILAAVEDYIANEEELQKGSELLSRAIQTNSPAEIGSGYGSWTEIFPQKHTSDDIVGLFRVKMTKIVAQLYTTN